MQTATPELAFKLRPASHRVRIEKLPLVIARLTGLGWRTAADLRVETGFCDRTLRACAQASDGRILSGQRGYCLIEEATPDEIARAANWLISQGKQMVRRGIATRRLAIKQVTGQP